MEREMFVLQFIEFSIDTGGKVFAVQNSSVQFHLYNTKSQNSHLDFLEATVAESLSWLGKPDYTDDYLHIKAQEGNNKTRKEDTRNTCLPE